jgi:hypothetical protein
VQVKVTDRQFSHEEERCCCRFYLTSEHGVKLYRNRMQNPLSVALFPIHNKLVPLAAQMIKTYQKLSRILKGT